MYYIRGFGQIDVRCIVSVGATDGHVILRLDDGQELASEADFDEVVEDIRVSQAIENSSSYAEMIENVYRIWGNDAGS